MSKRVINTSGAPSAIGPYSQAIEIDAGDKRILFLSGQIALVPETGTIESEDPEVQTHRIMKNIRAILEASGMSFKDIVKTTIFLDDLANFEKVNSIYSQYFSKPYPARSCVEVSRLPRSAKVEIEVIAVCDK